jgi:hypothetical protein
MVEIKVNFIAGLTLSNARYIKKKLLSLHLTDRGSVDRISLDQIS